VTAGEVIQHLRRLLTNGRSAEAIAQAMSVARSGSTDAALRADVMLMRLAGFINLGQRGQFMGGLNDAADAVRVCPAPDRYARLYAFAAIVAHEDGAFEQCVPYLVRAAQALSTVTEVDEEIACTWHDLAMAYSAAGFHGYALGAMEKSRELARAAGVSEGDYVTPTIRVRLAVWHDHLGDSEACLRVLRGVVDELPWHQEIHNEGLPMRPASVAAYGFAVARLATLGELIEVDPRPLLALEPSSQRVRDFRHLGDVCLRIAGGRAEHALRRLADVQVSPATVGAAELPRLRALAHLAAGRPIDAYTEDRQAFRLASAHSERLRELFIEGTAARLQHEKLQRRLARFEGQAVTDQLTGLPNRRYLEQHLQTLVERGRAAMVAVCDLDGFKQVNDVHGHLIGDLVLQRVAAILAGAMRRDDLVARYGGDEFVVVMPETKPDEGQEIAQRVARAVTSEDWSRIAPGTPIGVTIGWAYADGQAPLSEAFAAADRAMLRAKRAGRRPTRTGRVPELSLVGRTPTRKAG
jgi:diguanylate cyclase (GGDEF)-like protein